MSAKGEDGISGQFFALDLSKPWTSDTAAWIKLPESGRKDYIGAAMSLDGKTLLTSPGIYASAQRFSFESNTWSSSNTTFRESMYDVTPVTLGTDGTVLLVGGDSWEDGFNKYDIYSFDTDQTVTAQLPPSANDIPFLPGRRDYRVIWSEHLKSAVFYGGFGQGVSAPDIVSLYHPESKQWKGMRTRGFNNKSLSEHCMAITDDGRKLLVYGGRYEQGLSTVFSSDLYILDLVSGFWTEALYNDSKRGSAVCTVSGDYFLLWGGRQAISGPGSIFDEGNSSTPVFIYQISKNAWVSEYDPFAKPSTPNSIVPPAKSSSKLNIGAIVGGVVAAFGVVALGGFFVWRHKRRAQMISPQISSSSSNSRIPIEGKPSSGQDLSSVDDLHSVSSEEKCDLRKCDSEKKSVDSTCRIDMEIDIDEKPLETADQVDVKVDGDEKPSETVGKVNVEVDNDEKLLESTYMIDVEVESDEEILETTDKTNVDVAVDDDEKLSESTSKTDMEIGSDEKPSESKVKMDVEADSDEKHVEST
ncbi:hypothetical protein BGZ73_007043 [Actinomortierella ambigua]|nr:hypothetical protein BGZ73_007043 [Actinomortierella ambigua]